MRNAQIRRAAAADAAGIGAVHVASWQWAYRGQLPDHFLDTIDVHRRNEWWRRRLTNDPPIVVFVAERDGGIVGFCHVGPSDDTPESLLGELHAIYLLETVARQGIGSALMTAGLEALRDMAFDDAILWVLASNEGTRRFYEQAGWLDDGGRQTYTLRDDVEAAAVRYRIDLTTPNVNREARR